MILDKRSILIEKKQYIFGAFEELVRAEIKTKFIVSDDCIAIMSPNEFHKQNLEFIFIFDEKDIKKGVLTKLTKAHQSHLQFKIAPEVPVRIGAIVHGGTQQWPVLKEGKLAIFTFVSLDSKFVLNKILQGEMMGVIEDSYKLLSPCIRNAQFNA